MGDKGQHETGIEWTHVPGYKGATWNPVRGCVKISPGCKNCYAKTFAERWRGVAGHPYEQGFDLRLVPDKLDEPLRKTKPHAYFVNSMSDLHQDDVPHEFAAACYGVMAAAPRHVFMVLTKRAENMRGFFADLSAMRTADNPWAAIDYAWACARDGFGVDAATIPPFRRDLWPLPNVWLGVSVEDRKYGLPRVDVLRTIPAAVRFLSVEPLLEDLGDIDLTGIHWVIIGGESGHGARPFDLAWARRIRDQCREQDVPFFFKQPGDVTVNTIVAGSGLTPLRKKSLRSDLPRDLDVREWPKCVQAVAS